MLIYIDEKALTLVKNLSFLDFSTAISVRIYILVWVGMEGGEFPNTVYKFREFLYVESLL